ncbi:MAG: hypothetical protein WAU36_04100 [Cyclobacteriaceae bacterium]
MIDTFIKEGIHSFNFPYVGYHGESIGSCVFEVHFGARTGINVHTHSELTIFVSQEEDGAHGLEHFIENICTHFKTWLSPHIQIDIDPRKIVWYQVLPYYNDWSWKKVTMQWDTKLSCYHTATWEVVSPEIMRYQKTGLE